MSDPFRGRLSPVFMRDAVARGLTAAELARRSGLCQATVSRVVKHRHLARPETLRKLVKALLDAGPAQPGSEYLES